MNAERGIPGAKPLTADRIVILARTLGHRLREAGVMLAAAESCTGGMIAMALTETAGSSAWFERGFVSYSNESKQELLHVGADTLRDHGAVSEATAAEMAAGALANSRAGLALAVTGVAGPGGGSREKPVGTVCFGWAMTGDAVRTETRWFPGDRGAVRLATAWHAMARAIELVDARYGHEGGSRRSTDPDD